MIEEVVHAAPGRGPSDDAFGFAQARGAVHAWVIDGATSVSEIPDKVVPGLSDAAWFARALSAGIARAVRRHPLTDAAMARLLVPLLARFEARAGRVAAHDYPVAAMTYLSVTPARHGAILDVLDYADCFVARLPPGPLQGPPGHFARALPSAIDAVSLDRTGPDIAALRRERAERVEGLRRGALTIRPESATAGHRRRMRVPPAARVILGSDGIARLWEEYALTPRAAVLARIARGGVLSELARLRDFERAHQDHGAAPKPADDVTALVLSCAGRTGGAVADPARRRGHLRRRGRAMHWFAHPAGSCPAAALAALMRR